VALAFACGGLSASERDEPRTEQDVQPKNSRGTSRSSKRPDKTKKKAAATKEQLVRYYRAFESLTRSRSPQKLANAKRVLSKGYPLSRPVVVEATKSGSSVARAFAVRIIGERGEGEEDVEVVTSALRDSDAKVRLAAVMAIRRLGGEGFRRVADHLRHEKVRNIRKMGVETIERWKSPDAVRCLVSLLASEKDRQVRRFIVDSLRTLTGRKVGDDLIAWQLAAQEWLDVQEAEKVLDHLKRSKEET
jgi:HEAT repeat protein